MLKLVLRIFFNELLINFVTKSMHVDVNVAYFIYKKNINSIFALSVLKIDYITC